MPAYLHVSRINSGPHICCLPKLPKRCPPFFFSVSPPNTGCSFSSHIETPRKMHQGYCIKKRESIVNAGRSCKGVWFCSSSSYSDTSCCSFVASIEPEYCCLRHTPSSQNSLTRKSLYLLFFFLIVTSVFLENVPIYRRINIFFSLSPYSVATLITGTAFSDEQVAFPVFSRA